MYACMADFLHPPKPEYNRDQNQHDDHDRDELADFPEEAHGNEYWSRVAQICDSLKFQSEGSVEKPQFLETLRKSSWKTKCWISNRWITLDLQDALNRSAPGCTLGCAEQANSVNLFRCLADCVLPQGQRRSRHGQVKGTTAEEKPEDNGGSTRLLEEYS